MFWVGRDRRGGGGAAAEADTACKAPGPAAPHTAAPAAAPAAKQALPPSPFVAQSEALLQQVLSGAPAPPAGGGTPRGSGDGSGGGSSPASSAASGGGAGAARGAAFLSGMDSTLSVSSDAASPHASLCGGGGGGGGGGARPAGGGAAAAAAGALLSSETVPLGTMAKLHLAEAPAAPAAPAAAAPCAQLMARSASGGGAPSGGHGGGPGLCSGGGDGAGRSSGGATAEEDVFFDATSSDQCGGAGGSTGGGGAAPARGGDASNQADQAPAAWEGGGGGGRGEGVARRSLDGKPPVRRSLDADGAAGCAARRAGRRDAVAGARSPAGAAVAGRPGAAAAAAAAERAEEGLVLVCGAAMIPHVDKAATGGEDAYFVSAHGHGAFAVADGVSAWALDGIDPGDYSRTLVQNMREALEETSPAHWRRGAPFDGRALLRRAQLATFKPGSATAVFAALWPRAARPCGAAGAPRGGAGGDGGARVVLCSGAHAAHAEGAAGPQAGGGGGGGTYDLHVANLGDSGIKVIRGGRILLATQPQQHDFNLPFQLSHPRLCPETDDADMADEYVVEVQEGDEAGGADMADEYVVEVQEGDVIVAASDGLFDNMWDEELLSVLSEELHAWGPPHPHHARRWGALAHHHRASAPPAPGGAAHRRGGRGAFGSWGGWGRAQRALFGAAAHGPPAGGGEPGGAAPAAAPAGGAPLPRSGSAPDVAALGDAGASPPASTPAPPPPHPLEAAQRAASALARAAHRNAGDGSYRSPWAAAAGRQSVLARLFSRGGKMDDCTCIVAIVRDAAALAAP
ncbi:MAG: hypothetical protein J3K34DRAFT_516498 [Monoraphidium minutum]|nr:MAG: hypothetical protein J3K34DRAFT_516498 [Monoraphidium minutum]